MNIAFRTDASLEIGTGHVMRCLALAYALEGQGAKCRFICRAQPGNLLRLIRERGFEATALPRQTFFAQKAAQDLVHSAWLGTDWTTDAAQTKQALAQSQVDWLIVDHYALDERWEKALLPNYKKLMVIDDIADRAHICDLLVDENWFSDACFNRYSKLLPLTCKCFLGPEYALLMPEYERLRATVRPRDGRVRRVLIFLGGSDLTNQTGKVLCALMRSDLQHLQVDVVIGYNHPAAQTIAEQAALRSSTTLHQALPTLAHLMAKADLMISGGGTVTWERMCLGLPAIVISMAANQTRTNIELMKAGYTHFLGEAHEVNIESIVNAVRLCLINTDALQKQSILGWHLVRGTGTRIICDELFDKAEKRAKPKLLLK